MGIGRIGMTLAMAALALGCTARSEPAPVRAADSVAVAPPADGRLRGVTVDAHRPPDPGALIDLARHGVTHIVVDPYAFQPDLATAHLRFSGADGWYSESDSGIIAFDHEADSLGLTLLIKPHVWLGRGGGWVGDIDFQTEADWQSWETDYRAFILHHAELSARIGAPLFCVGTELARSVRKRPEFWRSLIRDVRKIYPGKLVYAANWYDEYEHITFWDALDYIGVQAYFPLSTASDPSLDALLSGWKAPKQAISALAQRTGKPVLFTEMGYCSAATAAAEPWAWPEHGSTAVADTALQARLYEAAFRSFWDEPWFAGALVWKWYPGPDRVRPGDWFRPQDRRLTDFTPQDKPAARVMARWFVRSTNSTQTP